MPLIELGQSEIWNDDVNWPELCETASSAAIDASPHASMLNKGFAVEISIQLSDDDEVRNLNASYRGKDKPTNVLSFPMVQADLLSTLSNTDAGEILLGDIILAHGICLGEAKQKQIGLTDHISHLVVHGTLHLLGYDHEEEADAIIMEDMEVQALANIGIENPYAEEEAAE